MRGLFSSLLPPANARRHREERDGLVPDALLGRPTEVDAMYKDHLHDVKMQDHPHGLLHLQLSLIHI